MILGVDELLKLVKEKKLVENLCDRELNNPTGAGFDLRIGEIFELESDGFLGIEDRHTPKTDLISKYKENEERWIILEPNKYYVIRTVETINCSEDLVGFMFPRSTLYRSGILVRGGVIDPGYKGRLSFGIINLNDKPFKLQMGARVANISFFEVKGKVNLYKGKWQGGRVNTKEKEKQI